MSGSFLAPVSRDLLGLIFHRSRLIDVPAGRVFAQPGRPRSGIVLDGLARVFAVRSDGSQVTLRRVGPGAAIGITAMGGRRKRTHAQAITDVEFIEFDYQLLIQLGREHAEIAMAIAEEIDRRLADTELQVESRGGSVVQRVAGALLDVSTEGEPLVVSMSQESLSAMIGASRERVGHELRKLAARGLIASRRGHITLLDPLQLQSVARNSVNLRAS